MTPGDGVITEGDSIILKWRCMNTKIDPHKPCHPDICSPCFKPRAPHSSQFLIPVLGLGMLKADAGADKFCNGRKDIRSPARPNERIVCRPQLAPNEKWVCFHQAGPVWLCSQRNPPFRFNLRRPNPPEDIKPDWQPLLAGIAIITRPALFHCSSSHRQ